MPISISAAQKKSIGKKKIEGEDADGFELAEVGGEFNNYGLKFLDVLAKLADERGVVASGNILSKADYEFSEDGTTMFIKVPDYYDYPNEGVKGTKSSANAPNSPYQYKKNTKGGGDKKAMLNSGFGKSIAKYIKSAKVKIKTVEATKDKALGIGREANSLSLGEVNTLKLMSLIKMYGIKETHYFTDALNETFKDFEVKMSAALGRDIIFSLEKINRNGDNNKQ